MGLYCVQYLPSSMGCPKFCSVSAARQALWSLSWNPVFLTLKGQFCPIASTAPLLLQNVAYSHELPPNSLSCLMSSDQALW